MGAYFLIFVREKLLQKVNFEHAFRPPQPDSFLETLATQLEGTLHWDRLTQTLYATDASVYREIPWRLLFPKRKKTFSD